MKDKRKPTFLLFLFTVLVGLIACQTKRTENQEMNPESDLTVSVVKIDTSLLKGIWWENKDAPVASFEIKDTTVYYPDQEVALSEFKYTLIDDSLVIFKPNMPVIDLFIRGEGVETNEAFEDLTETYKVEKLTKDTLTLGSKLGVFTYIKIQE